MLIENHPGAPEAPAPRNTPPRNDSQRWLAELEREFLQANDSAPHASVDGDGGRSSAQTATRDRGPDAARTPASGGADSGFGEGGRDCADPRHAAASGSATLSATTVDTANATATSPAADIADARLAMPPSAQLPADPPPQPIALSPSIAAERALGPRGHDGDPAAAASRAPAPRYARQLMSLTEGEHASAAIRDASLSPAESVKVAHNVSIQLHAAGFGVQRIFINGQRFDSTSTGIAPRIDRLQPLFQDDE